MSTLPPALLYFVIYNPTLRPTQPYDKDDEDLEEQAHVLFYTAKEHAVSRDRVLRQVGLAKAVANFTSMFERQSSYDSIHSLSRRMVTICPEPSYWIHACAELAKSQRPTNKPDKDKGKGKQATPVYDHDEASLHDAALRTQLTQGYERFKLLYGTFTSILSNQGRDALELQLERFFTVWAWSWDLSKPLPFTDYLGTRIHPLSSQLTPHITALDLPKCYEPVVLVAKSVVVAKHSETTYPPALLPYLQTLLDRPGQMLGQMVSQSSEGSEDCSETLGNPTQESQDHNREMGNVRRFLSPPQFSMSAMDVRRWNWPNYLSFSTRKSSAVELKPKDAADDDPSKANTENGSCDQEKNFPAHVRSDSRASNVDSVALEEALTSDGISISSASSRPQSPDSSASGMRRTIDTQSDDSSSNSLNGDPMSATVVLERKGQAASPLVADTIVVATSAEHSTPEGHKEEYTTNPMMDAPKPRSSFAYIQLHLPIAPDGSSERKRIPYIKKEDSLLALVPVRVEEEEAIDVSDLAGRIDEMLTLIQTTINSEQKMRSAALSSAPVQDVFQKSQYAVVAHREMVKASESFSCNTWQFHEGKHLLAMEPGVLEIFSRGQNPQDWHLVKRRQDEGELGEVYMEIARKEASLTDVDYELTSLIRRMSRLSDD